MMATDLSKYFDVLRRFVARWRAEKVAHIRDSALGGVLSLACFPLRESAFYFGK
jgi:hypothetical protein